MYPGPIEKSKLTGPRNSTFSINDSMSSASDSISSITLFNYWDSNQSNKLPSTVSYDTSCSSPLLKNRPSVSSNYSHSSLQQHNKISPKKKIHEIKLKDQLNFYAGVVVTSSRSSRRRMSNSQAAKLFALATSGSKIQKPSQNHSEPRSMQGVRTRSVALTNTSPLTPNRTVNPRSGMINKQ